eukprot:836198-Prymnesium_polylepis.1
MHQQRAPARIACLSPEYMYVIRQPFTSYVASVRAPCGRVPHSHSPATTLSRTYVKRAVHAFYYDRDTTCSQPPSLNPLVQASQPEAGAPGRFSPTSKPLETSLSPLRLGRRLPPLRLWPRDITT